MWYKFHQNWLSRSRDILFVSLKKVDSRKKKKKGPRQNANVQNILKNINGFLYSKSVFRGCPRSAGTTISRTRCFLLYSRN
jgi:hypothetical protein